MQLLATFVLAGLMLVKIECYNFVNKYTGLKLIKGEAELLIDNDQAQLLPDGVASTPWYEEMQKNRDTKGREHVEAAVKSIQRLTLQLDRSDGRADFTPDVLASKYYDFVSTCLRTGGSAWTAVLGPIEYVGLKLDKFLTSVEVGGEEIRVVNIGDMCYSMCSCLIDLNLKDKSAIEYLSKCDDTQVGKILDLSLALTRVALRYAVFKERLETHNPEQMEQTDTATQKSFTSLELQNTLENAPVVTTPAVTSQEFLEELVIPSNKRLALLLQFDLKVQEDDMPVKGSRRVMLRKDFIKDWVEQNDVF